MVLTVIAGIAESERELIHQRTSSGQIAAKARGVRLRRPPKLTAEQIALGHRLIKDGISFREAAKLLKCHHATLYRALDQLGVRRQVDLVLFGHCIIPQQRAGQCCTLQRSE